MGKSLLVKHSVLNSMASKVVCIAVCCIALAAMGCGFPQNDKPAANGADNQETTQPQPLAEQPAPPEIRIEPELASSLTDGIMLKEGMDSRGINTYAGQRVVVEKGQCFLEMRFLRRDIEGRLSNVYVEQFSMEGINGPRFSINSRTIEPSNCIRIAIGREGPATRMLKLGAEYQILGYKSPDEPRVNSNTAGPTFKIPEDLPPHSIYRVELVVLDEQPNKRLEEEKELARQRTIQDRITVNLEKSLASDIETEHGRYGAAYYQYVTYKQKPENTGLGGYFHNELKTVISGPNELGGELILFNIVGTPSGNRFTWSYAYIRNLQKRTVNIPQDADLVIIKKELIPVTISFDAPQLPVRHFLSRIDFCEKKESKVPLVGMIIDPRSMHGRYEQDILIKPGHYFLKLRGHTWNDQVEMGSIEIRQDQKRYDLKIPESIDWEKLRERWQ